MRFKNYLNEEVDPRLIPTLEEDCKPFIKDLMSIHGKNMLYTGRDYFREDFKLKRVRKERDPVDTPKLVHNWVDDWFYKKFGVRARSNSLFASFNYRQANSYGAEAYIAFPVGQYKAISSHKVDDLFGVIVTAKNKLGGPDAHMFDTNTWLEGLSPDKQIELKAYMYSRLDDADYRDKLMFHENEYMIVCDEYYIVKLEHEALLTHTFK